jgi:hypothetical protein
MTRGTGPDGIRRGTNYIHRAKLAAMRDMVPRQLAFAAAVHARCASGDHDATVAEKGRVTYLAYGKRVEPGTRYCRYCSTILPPEKEAES